MEATADEPLPAAVAVNVFTQHADTPPPPIAVPPLNDSPVAVGVATAMVVEEPPSFTARTTIRSPASHDTDPVDLEPLFDQVVSV